ncbi:MAG: aminopeptidase P N-terminal domain-containing protein, partial [Acidobacteriota bacterium]
MIAAVALIGLVLADAAPIASAPPAIPASSFAAHRDRFLAKLPAGSIAVFHAAAETSVETSTDPYRQSSDFWYLTGLSEPE